MYHPILRLNYSLNLFQLKWIYMKNNVNILANANLILRE